MASSAAKAAAASLRGSFKRPKWLVPGGSLHGFDVVGSCSVPEFDLEAFHLVHRKTKARYVHVGCDDTNNVFSVALRTPVTDSSGLPHVLEHSVLCGSEKFPVRDPFFKMTKRSLNTFMNALTGQEYTMYPFATQNEQDYHNLMQVYLDAVFFPTLHELDFEQEGHRLELDKEDPAKLVRTGVVYNEMKGTLGGASRVFTQQLDKALLPGTQYEFVSGGDPPEIARLLTHKRLVEFHRKHYHPSNALFFSYGDMDLDKHLRGLEDWALHRFEFSQDAADVWQRIAGSGVDVSQQLRSPKVVKVRGPAEPMLEADESSMFCMSRALALSASERPDEYERLKSSMASTLLLDGSSAPLYSALIDQQVAPDFSPGTGFDGGVHPCFGVGVQGIDGTDASVEEVRATILQVLRQVSEEGFDERRVRAVLHQFELGLKRKPTSFGLNIMQALSMAFAHTAAGDEAALLAALNESISVNHKLERLEKDMASDPNFWQRVVEGLFLRRDQASGELDLAEDIVQVLMQPDEKFVEKQAAEENEALEAFRAGLSQDDLEEIAEAAEALKKAQASEADLSCLPSLNVRTDVPAKHPSPVYVEDASAAKDNTLIWVKDQKTNGVVYFRALFDTSHVPDDLLPLMSIFTSMLGALATEDLSYQDLGVELDLSCDGLGYSSSSLGWFSTQSGPAKYLYLPKSHQLLSHSRVVSGGGGSLSNEYRQGVTVSGCCLARNLDKTIALLGDILTQSRFQDTRRLESLLATSISSASTNLTNGALGYARRWALGSLGGKDATREALGGLSQVELLLGTAGRAEELAPLLTSLLSSVFRSDNMSIAVVAGGSEIDDSQVIGSVGALSATLASRNHPSSDAALRTAPSGVQGLGHGLLDVVRARQPMGKATYIPLPIPVHNASVSVPTSVGYGHEDDAAMMVLGQVINANFLHKHVREQGGAYGSSASHDMDGVFSFGSYYDPRAAETLEDFARSIQWACAGSFEERDVDEALLSMFGSIDAPQEVPNKGSGAFFYGMAQEDRQAMRDRLFSVNRDVLIAAAEKHLGHIVANGDANAFINNNGKACVAIAGNESTADSVFAPMGDDWDIKQL